MAVGERIGAPADFANGVAIGAAVELADVERDLVADLAVALPRVSADISGAESSANVRSSHAGDVFREVTCPAVVRGHAQLVRCFLGDEVGAVKIFGKGDRAHADADATASGHRPGGSKDIVGLTRTGTTGEEKC